MTDITKPEPLALVPTPAPAAPPEPKAPAAPPEPKAPAPAPKVEAPVVTELPIPEDVCSLLQQILVWPRPHGTANEQLFNKWLKKKITDMIPKGVKFHVDSFAQAFDVFAVTLKRPDGTQSDVLFSCHVDTVDSSKTPMGERKKLVYDANFGLIFLDKDSPGGCLGADDGAGVWIMMKMIQAGKPGTYIFHRGEECGGLSAKKMKEHHKDWLKQFEVAVAFDRPRTDEVIVTQGGSSCASEKFGKALAESLNLVQPCFNYRVSHAGVYTDTKEYRTIIHECVNLGVGYQNQHGIKEELDYGHLVALLAAALKIDWDILPVDRDATKATDYTYSGGYRGYGHYVGGNVAGRQADFDDDGWDDQLLSSGFGPGRGGPATGKGKGSTKGKGALDADLEPENLIFDAKNSTIEELVAAIEQDNEWTTRLVIALLRENARLKADNRQLDTLLGQ